MGAGSFIIFIKKEICLSNLVKTTVCEVYCNIYKWIFCCFLGHDLLNELSLGWAASAGLARWRNWSCCLLSLRRHAGRHWWGYCRCFCYSFLLNQSIGWNFLLDSSAKLGDRKLRRYLLCSPEWYSLTCITYLVMFLLAV